MIIFEQSLSNFDEMNYVKYDNHLLINSADKSVLIDGWKYSFGIIFK